MARSTPKFVATSGAVKGLELLGHLTWYSIPDEPVPGTKLAREWEKAGLDPDVLPELRQGVHIFQSACKSVESKKGTNGHTGITIMVEAQRENPGECVYQITRIEKGDRAIEHPKAMTLRYDKATDEITLESKFEQYKQLKSVEEDIREHFKKHAKSTPGAKIRNAVRDTLMGLGAQNLRRKAGGIYFVPIRDFDGNPSEPVLDGLAQVFEAVYGSRADLETTPLVSDEKAQDMVAKHFAIGAAERSRALMGEVMARVKEAEDNGRSVRKDYLANMMAKRQEIAASVEQYEQLVSLKSDEIEKNLRDLDRAINQLADSAVVAA